MIPLASQPLCGILAYEDEVLLIGTVDQTLHYYYLDEDGKEPIIRRQA